MSVYQQSINLDSFLTRMSALHKSLTDQEKDPSVSEENKSNFRSYCQYKIKKLYKQYTISASCRVNKKAL